MIEIAGEGLSATINPFGAELTSLRDAAGRELMTDADPAFWTGHAPILFPIVGRLNGDILRLDRVEYPMEQHGFARRRMFELESSSDYSATLLLRDDAETRAIYPFAFDLHVNFTLGDMSLAIVALLVNTGTDPMPASLGYHPAFAWPLPFGAPRDAHRIVFAADEPEPIRQLRDRLIAGDRASPLDGRVLALNDALFADDALIWYPARSRSVRYGADGGPQLEIASNMPGLGIWTKPGAQFVCIEPWHGHADPAGFEGDFRDKPGVVMIAPGHAVPFRMDIRLHA